MIQTISLSGLDGSGKSTQVDMMRQHLEDRGYKVYYFHATHFSVVNKVKHALRRKKGEGSKDKANTSRNVFGIAIRIIVLPVDILRFTLLQRRLENQGYSYILSDRYFYDTQVNISYLLERVRPLSFRVVRPEYAFYINTDVQTILSRQNDHEQGEKYLIDKKRLYDVAATQFHLIPFNGNVDATKVHAAIMRHLKVTKVAH